MTPSYTTSNEVQAYLQSQPGGLPSTWPSDSTQQDALVEQAERLVDYLGAGYQTDPDTGMKFLSVLSLFKTYQVTALKRAVGAQVEYILTEGPSLFIEQQFSHVKGPDFETFNRKTPVSPKARREIAMAGIARTTAFSK